MSINYIDGIRLHRSFTAGLKRVVSRQEYLNKINAQLICQESFGYILSDNIIDVDIDTKEDLAKYIKGYHDN